MLLISPAFQCLQPVVFARGGEVYLKTRRQAGAVTLVTASGVVHPLRRMCSPGALMGHIRRDNAANARQLLEAELARRRAAACSDVLRYVVEQLAPSFGARDW